MKKFLMTLLLMLPVSAYALSVGTQHDVTINAGSATIGVSQDGNEVSVGASGLTFSTSDTVDFGVDWSMDLIGGLSGGVSYDYTNESDHVLGVDTTIGYWGANLDTTFAWNINDSDIDATVGTGYSAFGLGGNVTANFDIDRFSYEGLDVNAGYTWTVSDNFSVRPNVTVPFDGGFGLGDISAGVSVSVLFGSTPSE